MHKDDFSIRPARGDDLPLLGPLEVRAGLRMRESRHPYCADFPHFDAARLAELARSGTVWVAVGEEDQPVGFVIAERWAGDGYVHELDVDVPHGRRGIGRALVRRVAEWARDVGCSAVLLSTFSDVPWNAPFYARLGFNIVPLEEYTDAMRVQRASDGQAGLLLASRVMMRAPLSRLLG
jgi:GNAT superfamily N-acetyltransferase